MIGVGDEMSHLEEKTIIDTLYDSIERMSADRKTLSARIVFVKAVRDKYKMSLREAHHLVGQMEEKYRQNLTDMGYSHNWC
ncbi:MAG: hypothetical protein QMD85_05610 [Candidatus Aenigmarchaeota archaeon]|nr:hypothetical protein [Candidatus Aenigmarchaeota archaeon]